MARSFRQWPAIAAVAFKSAKIISLLKLVKFTKILVTATSMAISMVAYGWTFGPAFAIGLISMLFIHEMGHVIAMKRKGLPTSMPVFIPFLGAAIFVKSFGDRATEAYVGYGGPLLGTIGALLCVALWWFTGSPLLLATAFLGIYLNLFNMIPIRPLDGGRIVQVMGKNTAYAGMLILIAYTVFMREPSLLLVWLFVLQDMTLPVWWRSVVAWIVTAAMIVLFALGYSTQPWWLDSTDVVVASFFIYLYLTVDRARSRRVGNEAFEDVRSYPPAKTRFSWLGVYLGSVLTLWGMMWYLIEQMPPM